MADAFETEFKSAEERLHDSKISENYKKLLDSASPVREEEAPVREPERSYAPAEPETDDREIRPAFVRNEITADNAARLADYTAHPAPAEEGKRILFENEHYTRGRFTTGPQVTAEAAAPVREAVYRDAADVAYEAPAPVREESRGAELAAAAVRSAEEDACPTARTMRHRTKTEEVLVTDDRVGFWATIPMKTKLLIAAVLTAIVVAVLIVCINTATLDRISAQIAQKQGELIELREEAREIEDRLDQVTDPDYVDQWAAQHGMVKN